MRLLDLFSGIGGFSLAARWCGWQTVAFCEIEKYCQRVLRKNFGKDITIYDDIKKLTAADIGHPIDVISGGFPCQPFSNAGQRRGTADDRHLWPEMLRVVAEVRPRWFVGENVTGFVDMELDNLLAALENSGYTARTFIIPAAGVGAPHLRKRVWIVAYTDSPGRREQCQPQPVETEHVSTERGRSDVPDAAGVRCAGRAGRELGATPQAGRIAQLITDVHRRGAVYTHDWQTESGVCRVVDGLPRRVDRLRGLGNAIVPQIAYEIFNAISMLESQHIGEAYCGESAANR